MKGGNEQSSPAHRSLDVARCLNGRYGTTLEMRRFGSAFHFELAPRPVLGEGVVQCQAEFPTHQNV
eukprot:4698407-Amphidinium_carterae.2